MTLRRMLGLQPLSLHFMGEPKILGYLANVNSRITNLLSQLS